jgi:hypothetical protein
VVEFKAYDGLPIFLMLWLLRQLDVGKLGEKCGFGQVIIIDHNGLPHEGYDNNLHYSSGIIHWD